MLKKIKRIIDFIIATLYIIAVYAAFSFDCEIAVRFENINFSFQLSELLIVLTIIIAFKLLYSWLATLITSMFSRNKADVLQLVIDTILNAITCIMLKSPGQLKNNLEELKKNTKQSRVLFNWIQGHIHLLKGNEYEAKIAFNNMNTALGWLELYNIALTKGDRLVEAELLEKLLNKTNNNEKIASKILALALLENDFRKANATIDLLNNTRKIAVTKYYEAVHDNPSKKKELLEQAFKLEKKIPDIAIEYANELILINNVKAAQKVLLAAWQAQPSKNIFLKYIACCETDKSHRLDAADELICANNSSWIGYYEFGKLLLHYERYNDAFLNLLTAYGKNRSQFVIDLAREAATHLPDPKPLSAKEILSKTTLIKELNCQYICKECNTIYDCWQPICDKCHDIATLEYVEKE